MAEFLWIWGSGMYDKCRKLVGIRLVAPFSAVISAWVAGRWNVNDKNKGVGSEGMLEEYPFDDATSLVQEQFNV